MYAIVDIAGQQYKVEKGQKLFVHRLPGDEGSAVAFDKVLLMAGDDNTINLKNLKYSSVKATILSHLKGDKKIVFKKKRRKGYKVKNGHRQALTQIQVEDIVA
jgi:large subunit ribosomal protein L21